eukprot:GFYU01005263.1.p1 GENE.GFYU01005263.1~~GFYU01005263.1.p1  ORF type:complete len:447 (+),score=102.17 GFYU01005263.1:99-1439(+)
MSTPSSGDSTGRLSLPCANADEWSFICEVLGGPLASPADLDAALTQFSSLDVEPKTCTFFTTVPGSVDAGVFDFELFFAKGLPFMVEVALEMPTLFKGVDIPIYKTRSACVTPSTLNKHSFAFTRRQCACLLAHSFFGSLKRPDGVQLNDFRFTVFDLFVGTAVSPNSGTTFLNYFCMLAKHGIPDGMITIGRNGYPKGPSPWTWENNETPLCQVKMVDGSIDDCTADIHVEFANAFVGGGVMTGDAAMEEILFLVKPELMVAMAVQNRMADEESVCVSGAIKYSRTKGYGTSLEFDGDATDDLHVEATRVVKVVAIDAIRGGGPAMTEAGLLRDMNKARVAFEGATAVGTGHWGCGAFGNNHDLMFLKQWLAASEAGATRMYYHDFDRKQSHHIHPLVRKLKHMTAGQLWGFLRQRLIQELQPYDVATFSKRVADVAVGRIDVPK